MNINDIMSKLDVMKPNLRKEMAKEKKHFIRLRRKCDASELFELVNMIRERIGMARMHREDFDKGIQFRNVWAINYKEAEDALCNLILGWW